jgi:hypothetical protein
MITKESLKGRGFEIRTYRIREPKPVPESQKKARNPQVTVGPPFYFRSSPFLGEAQSVSHFLAQIDCFKRAPVSSLEEPCSDSRGCQVLAPGESLL